MDTRVTQQQQSGKDIDLKGDDYIEALQEQDQQEFEIKQEEIQYNPKFLESLVYNLVQKQDLKQNMEYLYNQQLVYVKTYPDIAKYYIHIPFLLPTLAMSLMYLRYRNKLTLNKTCFILCAASMVNEFARYKRILGLDEKKTEQYNEHSSNFQYLLRKYTNSCSGLDMVKYVFGIDIKKSLKTTNKMYYDEEINKEFLTFNYV